MSVSDPQVIEAARKAFYVEQAKRFGTHDHPPEIIPFMEPPGEMERAIFTAAIKAADTARAPMIRAAVSKLIDVCTDDEDEFVMRDGWLTNRIEDAEAELLKACGIEQEDER